MYRNYIEDFKGVKLTETARDIQNKIYYAINFANKQSPSICPLQAEWNLKSADDEGNVKLLIHNKAYGTFEVVISVPNKIY